MTKRHLLALASALITVGAVGCEPSSSDEDHAVAQTGDDALLPTPDAVWSASTTLNEGPERELDHEYDDVVTPADDLDDLDSRFQGDDALNVEDVQMLDGAVHPPSTDLRPFAKVVSQGKEGSCTAYAVAGAMQVLANAANQEDDMSAAHLWNLQKKVKNASAALNTALASFLAPISVWPNGAFTEPTVSNPNTYGFARLTGSRVIPSGLTNVLAQLGKGKPVVLASTLNDSWRYMGSKGIIRSNAASTGTWMHAAHAYDLVGYVEDTRFEDGGYFIVKNSWGTRWGDHGYAYMPFSYCRYQRMRKGGYCIFYALDGVQIKGGSTSGGDTPPVDETPAGAYVVKVKYGANTGTHQKFQLYIDGSAADLANVQKVTYDVHPTFGAAAITTSTDAESAFASVTYSTYASGWSTKGTTVTTKSGKTIALAGTTIRWR